MIVDVLFCVRFHLINFTERKGQSVILYTVGVFYNVIIITVYDNNVRVVATTRQYYVVEIKYYSKRHRDLLTGTNMVFTSVKFACA